MSIKLSIMVLIRGFFETSLDYTLRSIRFVFHSGFAEMSIVSAADWSGSVCYHHFVLISIVIQSVWHPYIFQSADGILWHPGQHNITRSSWISGDPCLDSTLLAQYDLVQGLLCHQEGHHDISPKQKYGLCNSAV